MNRPMITPDMIEAAAKLTAESACNIADKSEFSAAIVAAYDGHIRHMNGFELGKALDNAGWHVDAMLVEDLDCMDNNLREVHRAACNQWAEENDIQPPLPIGTIIKEGEITGIYEHGPASYLVKPLGQIDSECGNRRTIIRYEDAVKAA